MLQFPLKPLSDYLPPPFPVLPPPLLHNLYLPGSKSSKFVVRCSTTDSETLHKSAIQRIADKLRSLGFKEEAPESVSQSDRTFSPGDIFVPLPKKLPKYRVGHTIDSSWSTPENPVPEPGTGNAITRFHELRNAVEKKKPQVIKKREERAPTLAELSLPKEELRRLGEIGFKLKNKIKIGKAGITEGIVNTIHEQWRRSEVVKIVCEDLCRFNMKRTHDMLERKTGGIVAWRSGTKIILYRGPNYKYPYFSVEILKNEASQAALPDSLVDDGEISEAENPSSATNGEKSVEPTSTDKVAHPTLIQGVGAPNRVRLQLPGEAELAEDADSLLEGLGPRFSDWWGYDPLPIDADLLPAIVPGYRKPFRLLPYGVKPKLTNDEMTSLRRLSRPLPCHFALGRNRNLQGLAASIAKLWEKSEIAKIAVKRGVQNTNSELMAKELQWLTGGTLLSRDREFIVLYRGKDFLPFCVSSAIERERYARLHKMKLMTQENTLFTSAQEQKLEISESGPTNENQRISIVDSDQRKLMSSETSLRKISIKLSMTLDKKAKAERLLAQLEEEEKRQQPEIDKEGINVEERYMLKKVGLKMKPFLLLGRRGVFDGTVENMHLHWKYRELVKIITNEKNIKTVHDAARILEAESGGILVAVERVNRSHAIIIYRGKNYERPSRLRPESLLTKKEALKRSIEAQRRKSLKLHVLKLTENAEELKLKLEKDKEAIHMDLINTPRIQPEKKETNEVQISGSLKFDAETDGYHACLEENERTMVKDDHATSIDGNHSSDTSINSLQVNKQDKMIGDFLKQDDNKTIEQLESPAESIKQEIPAKASMDVNTEIESIQPVSRINNHSTRERVSEASDANIPFALNEKTKPSFRLDKGKRARSLPLKIINQPGDISTRALQLSNKERLLLRRQALKMKKRPVLAVGKSNIVTGVAKTIKEHFKKHPLAIVNVKGRAKGTSVEEIVFKLEKATGGVLVSREPSKVILYRGWEAEERPQNGKQNVTKMENKDEAQSSVSPELLAAIRVECGLQ